MLQLDGADVGSPSLLAVGGPWWLCALTPTWPANQVGSLELAAGVGTPPGHGP